MKKQFICFIAILTILLQTSICTFAQVDSLTKVAIRKYKKGNYTGCLQDCQYIVSFQPKNAMAYYYLAMSYVQAGKQDEAIKAYSKVLSLKPNPKKTHLAEYSQTGIRCLQTPDQCRLVVKKATPSVDTTVQQMSDLDKFIASPPSDGLSKSVREDFRQKQLNNIKNEINSDKDVDDYQLNKLNEIGSGIKVAQSKPSDDEIKAALKTLNDAGINPYAQTNNYQNSDLSQVNMLMGGSKDNSMLNMIPFMLGQNKDGMNNYSPQIMQAVIMNSMMPDFTLNLDKDK